MWTGWGAYAGDNPANFSDPSGNCDSTFIIGGLCNAGKAVLRRAVIGLNDAITSFAQSGFSNGVNDAVIAFALSVQNLPKSVHHLIDDYLRHPEDALALLGQVLLQVLLPLNPLTALQAVQTLAGLLGHLRAEVDCKGLGYTAGYTLTDFILKFALTDAAGGLGKLATEALAEGAALKGGSPCSLCFPAGTLVATPGGEKPIEQLHTGDTVLAEDPTTGTVEAERVAATIVHPASELASVGLSDGSGVTVTADHPFYVDASAVRKQAGWVQAGDLRVGDRLRDASGRDVSVVGVRYNVGRAVVYTLSVAIDHSFFVGTARVLVHNIDCPVVPRVNLGDLPAGERQAVDDTIARIPIPGSHDPPTSNAPPGVAGKKWGVPFQNRPLAGSSIPELPFSTDPNYYHEYRVILPGQTKAGVLRIVTGSHGELYYTWRHYGTANIPGPPFVRLR